MASAFTPSSTSMIATIPRPLSATATTRTPSVISVRSQPAFFGQTTTKERSSSSTLVVSAVGDVSADGTTYLVAGAIAVALLGTAFPILFSRKDLCPECDGAGFVRRSGVTLRANAARKDQNQIVCPRCNGLGKLGQIDK